MVEGSSPSRPTKIINTFVRFAADYDRFAELEPPHILKWLLRHLPAHGGRALDAGCGAGRHTLALAERYENVVAVDISEPLIDIARQRRSRQNVRYQVSDLMTFADPDGFDLVFSSTTLHHVSDLDAALLHLRGLVTLGSMAILIDNVASRPTPARWVHLAGAWRHLPSDFVRLGGRQAVWLFKFRTGVPWLAHLASDRYFSRHEFERHYGAIFPGARFHELGYAQALVWQNTNQPAASPG